MLQSTARDMDNESTNYNGSIMEELDNKRNTENKKQKDDEYKNTLNRMNNDDKMI